MDDKKVLYILDTLSIYIRSIRMGKSEVMTPKRRKDLSLHYYDEYDNDTLIEIILAFDSAFKIIKQGLENKNDKNRI